MINAIVAKKNAIDAQEIMKLEELKEELERQAKLAELIQRTIEFCDSTLSVRIDQESRNGQNSLHLYCGKTSWYGHPVSAELREDKAKYANGDSSFSMTKDYFHVPTLCDYLVKNGYAVKSFDYTYKEYGFGGFSGIDIRIQWNS